MRRTLSGRVLGREFRCGTLPPEERIRESFTDHASAARFLRRLGTDESELRTMRELYAEESRRDPSRASDRDVIEYLAWNLVLGRLSVWRERVEQKPVPTGAGAAAAPPPPSPAPPTPPRSTARPGPDAPPEENDFSPNLDTGAFAAVLRDAARDGTPFCEECERQRQAA